MSRRGTVIGLAGVCLLLACGYRLSNAPPAGQKPVLISIQTFSNPTLNPGLELSLATALRESFSRARRIRFVEDPALADYHMTGTILSLATRAQTFTGAVRAVEFSLSLRIDVVVTDRNENPIRINGSAFQVAELYQASLDVEVGRKNREEAIRVLSASLADLLYDALDGAIPGADG